MARLDCDLIVAQHRTPDEGKPPTVCHNGIDRLLDAVQVAGKTGDDHPAGRLSNQIFERAPDGSLGGYETGPLGVGRVGKQQPNTLPAEPGQSRQVGGSAIDWRRVELEVAAMDHQALWRIERDTGGVRHGMGHRNVAESERAFLDPGSQLNRPQVGLDAHLADPGPGKLEGERGAVDRHVDLTKQVPERADVILVAMSQDHARQRLTAAQDR